MDYPYFYDLLHARSVLKMVHFVKKLNAKLIFQSAIACSKLIIKAPERRQWRSLGVFIVNFEHISHLVLVFSKLTLNR